MNSKLNEPESNQSEKHQADIRQMTDAGLNVRSTAHATARAAMVNRTHRVVHERAKTMQARRSKARSLWVPMLVCSALVIILCTTIWTILDEYELVPTGMPDASQQILVLLLWFLPLSAALLAMVWFRRTRSNRERAEEEQA